MSSRGSSGPRSPAVSPFWRQRQRRSSTVALVTSWPSSRALSVCSPVTSSTPCPGLWPHSDLALREVRTADVAETEQLAVELGESLRGGEVVLLRGELGAGKTAFVRGLARGLGVDPGEVSSPTFVLLTSHEGSRLRLYHADLYRLKGDGDEVELGLEELPGPRGVLAVEWAERLAAVCWKDVYSVELRHEGSETRLVRIDGGVS